MIALSIFCLLALLVTLFTLSVSVGDAPLVVTWVMALTCLALVYVWGKVLGLWL